MTRSPASTRHVSRSGYTGEDGYEISAEADRCGRAVARLARRSRGEADRPRRARFAAARGGALPLRPRHRHHHLADRGRPHLVDPEAPPRRGRLSGRGAHPARDRRGPVARARRPEARGPGPGARGRRSPPRTDARSAPSPPAASARPSTGLSPWATWRATSLRRARSFTSWCAASRWPRGSRHAVRAAPLQAAVPVAEGRGDRR